MQAPPSSAPPGRPEKELPLLRACDVAGTGPNLSPGEQTWAWDLTLTCSGNGACAERPEARAGRGGRGGAPCRPPEGGAKARSETNPAAAFQWQSLLMCLLFIFGQNRKPDGPQWAKAED